MGASGPERGQATGASVQPVGVKAVGDAEVGRRIRSPSQALSRSLPAAGGPGRAAEGWAGTGQEDRLCPGGGGHAQDVGADLRRTRDLRSLPGAREKSRVFTHSGVPTRRCGFISTSQVRHQEVLAESRAT